MNFQISLLFIHGGRPTRAARKSTAAATIPFSASGFRGLWSFALSQDSHALPSTLFLGSPLLELDERERLYATRTPSFPFFPFLTRVFLFGQNHDCKIFFPPRYNANWMSITSRCHFPPSYQTERIIAKKDHIYRDWEPGAVGVSSFFFLLQFSKPKSGSKNYGH